MLEALRKWGKRHSAPSDHATGHSRLPGQTDREYRAATVANLRSEISRIQHDISVLDDRMSETDVATSAQDDQMASLHKELASTQRELGKYQARI